MSRLLRRADDFLGDFDHQYQWYLVEAGETVARRYLDAVWRALEELSVERLMSGRRDLARRLREPPGSATD